MWTRCDNPNCRKEYWVPDNTIGKRTRCKKCGTVFAVKEYSDSSASSRAATIPEPPPDSETEASGPVEPERLEPQKKTTGSSGPRFSLKEWGPTVLTAVMVLSAMIVIQVQFKGLVSEMGALKKENHQMAQGLSRLERRLGDLITTPKPPADKAATTAPRPELGCDDYDFRKTVWGMSGEVVKLSEGRKPDLSEGNTLGYKGQIRGREVFIFYIFVQDQLVRARYVLAERHKNKNDYLADYENFTTALVEKYGPPREERTEWKNDRYKEDASKWGVAVASGDMERFASWNTCTTRVDSRIKGENFNIDVVLEFSSRKLAHLETQGSAAEPGSDI